MKRITWDQYFMAQSHLLASRSTCTRLVVGATIVRDKRIIAGGYNGSISGGEHCVDAGCYLRDGHCIRTIHAEMNAILQCAKFGESTDHAEIYVTHYPCLQCCKAIIQAGIRNVYYANDYHNDSYAAELYRMAGVGVKKVPLERSFRLNDREKAVEQESEQKRFIDHLLGVIESSDTSVENLKELKQQADRIFYSDH